MSLPPARLGETCIAVRCSFEGEGTICPPPLMLLAFQHDISPWRAKSMQAYKSGGRTRRFRAGEQACIRRHRKRAVSARWGPHMERGSPAYGGASHPLGNTKQRVWLASRSSGAMRLRQAIQAAGSGT